MHKRTSTLLGLLLIVWEVSGYWQLTFSDEFNSQSKVNTTKWNVFYRFTPAVINNELQFYSPDAFAFSSSSLKIAAEKRAKVISPAPSKFNYTSGVITTAHKFTQTYGYFEMNAKVPVGTGYWPAWWLLPENADSAGAQEIDIMEMVMNQPTTVHTTFHCNYSTGGAIGKGTTIANFNTSMYHRFGLQWLPNRLIWYVDGVQVYNHTSPCVPKKPLYLLANLAVGGGWPGPPNAATVFPSYFEIDYIRVYKYASSGISIGGPGAGIAFTAPTPDLPAKFKLSNPKATPENVSPGQKVNVSVTVMTDTTAYSNIVVQFLFNDGSFNGIGSVTLSSVSIAAHSTVILAGQFTIPSTLSSGQYVYFGFGAWTANWASNFVWETTIGVVGINKVVGRSDHL